MRTLASACPLLLLLLAPLCLAAAGAPDFAALLHEGGLEWSPPDDFSELQPQQSRLLPHEKRLRSADGLLEIRYAIRPLGRIEIAYDDPHSSAPAANDLFEMLFRSISEAMAADSRPLSRAYLPADAKKEFNAGWASVAVFDVDADTSTEFSQAMLVAIHQNDKADAYTLILTNDLQQHKERIKRLRISLKFSSYDYPINQPGVADRSDTE